MEGPIVGSSSTTSYDCVSVKSKGVALTSSPAIEKHVAGKTQGEEYPVSTSSFSSSP